MWVANEEAGGVCVLLVKRLVIYVCVSGLLVKRLVVYVCE